MSKTLITLSALALAVGIGTAQIKAYTLGEMVGESDDAVFGTIVDRDVFRVDDPIDGPELYFTTLTIEGRSMSTDAAVTVQVTYHGGFLNEEEGVYNSEAPAEDDVQIGNQIVAFYKWADNIGGGVAANVLMAAHGGLYRTVQGPRGATVLGRGEGYAVGNNIRVENLGRSIKDIMRAQKR